MTAFVLKLIAVVCMGIDHIGAVFIMYTPDWFRWIGRIAFPIYAFLVAEGCSHTKNMNKYMLRLGLFALISEIPFDLAFHQSYWILRDLPLEINFMRQTNVFYTLCLGVTCVNIYEKLNHKPKQWIAVLIPVFFAPFVFLSWDYAKIRIIFIIYTVVITAYSLLVPNIRREEVNITNKALALIPALPLILLGNLLGTDYGMFGIAWILILYLAKSKRNRLIVLLCGIVYEYGYPPMGNIALLNYRNIMMLIFALVAFVLVLFYNGQRGRRFKWPFYWFYPVHIAAIALVWLLFVRPAVNGF